MYQQSSDFLDTDLHAIKFDINELTEQLMAEGKNNSMAEIISTLFEKMQLTKVSYVGVTKRLIIFFIWKNY